MIPVHSPVLGKKEIEYVNESLRANWISFNGKYNKKFESEFAKFCGVNYGLGVTNGTTALHIALAALKIGKGDEVIVPDFTMASCGFAVAYLGATPIFIDAEPKTWNIDPKKIEEKITPKTKAIMPVHIYGHPCDMDAIMTIARKHNLKVIEDCAEAHGALYKGKKVGSFGDINAFSFYSNKIITTGEGGMVVTDNPKLAERARWLHSLAFDPERRFIHNEIGFNYRMSNLQAAIGLGQLERIEAIIQRKRDIAYKYNQLLKNVKGIQIPPEEENVKNVYWMYGITITEDFGMSRDKLKKELYKKGIDTRFFFSPLHAQTCFNGKGYNEKEFPVSIQLSKTGLYLPSGLDLTNEQMTFIYNTLKGLSSNSAVLKI